MSLTFLPCGIVSGKLPPPLYLILPCHIVNPLEVPSTWLFQVCPVQLSAIIVQVALSIVPSQIGTIDIQIPPVAPLLQRCICFFQDHSTGLVHLFSPSGTILLISTYSTVLGVFQSSSLCFSLYLLKNLPTEAGLTSLCRDEMKSWNVGIQLDHTSSNLWGKGFPSIG
jgi:hypothetical protein